MMTQNGKPKELKSLDLDGLALEPMRIRLPDNSCLQVKDMDVQTYMQFVVQVRQMNAASALKRPVALAEAVLVFLDDGEEARRQIEELPITCVIDIWTWLRELKEPEYVVVLPEPLGNVAIGGKRYPITYPSVHAYNRLLISMDLSTIGRQVGEGELVRYEDASAEEIYESQVQYMAAMTPGATPKMLRELPPRKLKALDDFLTDVVAKALDAWMKGQQERAGRPTPTRGGVSFTPPRG